jgi:hypothetical protein
MEEAVGIRTAEEAVVGIRTAEEVVAGILALGEEDMAGAMEDNETREGLLDAALLFCGTVLRFDFACRRA